MVSEVFLTFAVTSFIGCVLAIGNLCYRSKCKEIGFCCISIKRDVEIEEIEDLEMIRNKKGVCEEEKKG
jgi:hypothetical protein